MLGRLMYLTFLKKKTSFLRYPLSKYLSSRFSATLSSIRLLQKFTFYSFKFEKRWLFFCFQTAAKIFLNSIFLKINCFRVFHGFGKAIKFANGGSILGSSQFALLPQLPLKQCLIFKKVVQIDSNIITLLQKSKSEIHSVSRKLHGVQYFVH